MSNPEVVEHDRERYEKTYREETPDVHRDRLCLLYDMNGK
jgi:hypothetical protein